jgi:DNA-binding NarL/FixJ family response regulator
MSSEQSEMVKPHITLMIVDDHAFYRESLRAMLERIPEIEVIAEASDGQEAIVVALERNPDVILMDVRMPGMDGISATRAICAQNPQIRILIVTMQEDDDTVFSALRAGAKGYVLKDSSRADLERAIWAVSRRESIFSAGVAERILHFLSAPQLPAPVSTPSTPNNAQHTDLTEREQEALQGLVDGLSNAEIGLRLGITAKTVRNYLLSVYDKLQVRDRVQAVLYAKEHLQ